MKRTLRLFALGLAVIALLGWLVLGANRGWTRTSVAVKTVDSITGLEGIEYQNRFVPGVELLGTSLLAAGLLAGGSFLFKEQKTT